METTTMPEHDYNAVCRVAQKLMSAALDDGAELVDVVRALEFVIATLRVDMSKAGKRMPNEPRVH
jgi:hypothetical protein